MNAAELTAFCYRVVKLPEAHQQALLYALIGGHAVTEAGSEFLRQALENEEKAAKEKEAA